MAAPRSRLREHVALSFMLWIYGAVLLVPLPGNIAWTRLKKYAGLELGNADRESREQFERDLARALPSLGDRKRGNAVYGALLKLEGGIASVRYVLIDNDIGPDPAGSHLAFLVLDENGTLLEETSLWMGWRTHFGTANVAWYPGSTPVPLIEIRTGNSTTEEFTQTYGFRKNRVVLLREEGPQGPRRRGCRKDSAYPGATWTESEWRAWTGASDPVEILAPLVWLGGTHDNPAPAAAIAALPFIRERLDGLARSRDAWIRRAADCALHPE